jgi:hypothetical protein
VRTVRDRGWWTALLAAITISGLGYFPLMILGGLVPANALLSQGITTEVAVWALGTALITVLLRRLLKASDALFSTEWLPSLLIALGVVGIGYLSLSVVSGVFQTDYRFWIVALKPMSLWQFGAFLVYLPAFAAYYLLIFRALHSDLAIEGESRFAQYATAKTAMAGGIFLIVAADYVPLFASGRLLLPFDPLHPIIAIQFVAILAIVALIAVYTYRRTNSYVPGALISALFVTWYVTAGTATMV